MRHLIKYKLREIVREWSLMFWALAWPIILGTLFYVSFGNGNGMQETLGTVMTAVVIEDNTSEEAKTFETFLKEMDGDTIEISVMEEEKALKQLRADKVDGIYYVKEEPSLTVAKSDVRQSILKAILDTFNQNVGMIKKVAEEHPEQLPQALAQLADWKEMIKEVDGRGEKQDPNVMYFFTLIAYACLSGAFLGVKSSIESQANLSALGARKSITPTHKLKLIVTDMAALFGVHFVNVMIVTLYVEFILGIHLGDNPGKIVLVDLLGSMIGVSMGILIGCFGRFAVGIKMGLCVLCTLFPSFLAGLMVGSMKDIIEHTVPIVNRINPAAVLSDSFYCMGIYDDPERFARNLLILGGMSAAFCLIAFFRVRRERYDSI